MFVTRRKHKREIEKLQDAVRVAQNDYTDISEAYVRMCDALAETDSELRRAKDLIYRSEKTNGSR